MCRYAYRVIEVQAIIWPRTERHYRDVYEDNSEGER